MGVAESIFRRLPKTLKRPLIAAAVWYWQGDLSRLATIFRTDKWGEHWYTQHYQRYFHDMRSRKLNLLEIGVGGYDDLHEGAKSLRMWKHYFRRSRIVGIDIFDKSHFSESRIDVLQCDQTDADALKRISESYGGFDIIIDDGSHVSEHVICSFQVLFPLLRPNGIYAIEDTQTSYWTTWGGGASAAQTTLNYFKSLIDGLNHVEYPDETYEPTYFDRNIVEIAFFHNLVILRKGDNNEISNASALIDRERQALKGQSTAT